MPNVSAGQLIVRAMRLGRVIGKDQTPTSDEYNDAFDMLNWLLDQLWLQSLATYRPETSSFALPAAAQTRTVGPGGQFNMVRPVHILPAPYVILNGVSLPVALIENPLEYQLIQVKDQTGTPLRVWYDAQFPLGVMTFWPVPDQAYQFVFQSYSQIETVALITDILDVPPGYMLALIANLAVLLPPEYGKSAPESVQKLARDTLATVKRNNHRPIVAQSDPLMVNGVGEYTAFNGWMA